VSIEPRRLSCHLALERFRFANVSLISSASHIYQVPSSLRPFQFCLSSSVYDEFSCLAAVSTAVFADLRLNRNCSVEERLARDQKIRLRVCTTMHFDRYRHCLAFRAQRRSPQDSSRPISYIHARAEITSTSSCCLLHRLFEGNEMRH
jgi:hypothetical protein